MGNYDIVMKKTENFRRDRFGLFIHWGLYSVAARHEWVKSFESLTNEAYQKYFDNFTAENYDPKSWAKLAKEAGMKYAVLTTKHHEGFCLFDSMYTDYKATNTKAGRDLVKEFVEAFRSEGIKVGFYYSLIDWHHSDYPHYGDSIHPRKNDPTETNEGRDFSRYIEYMHNQVRELLTNYGKIDIMWFDFSYGEMNGEKWEATKLVNMIRELQPHIIIDNRLVGSGEDKEFPDLDEVPVYSGDFFSPEQFLPASGLVDAKNRPIPWEACITTQANSWGYVGDNDKFMTAREIIYTLVDCVSKNGNLLINVGPTAKGEFPKKTVKLLTEVGEWMHENSESIYGCGSVDAPVPQWGRLTSNGKDIYVHFFDKAGYCMNVEGISPEDVEYALYLEDLSEVKIGDFWNSGAMTGGVPIPFAKSAGLKNPIDTVIKLVMKK